MHRLALKSTICGARPSTPLSKLSDAGGACVCLYHLPISIFGSKVLLGVWRCVCGMVRKNEIP